MSRQRKQRRQTMQLRLRDVLLSPDLQSRLSEQECARKRLRPNKRANAGTEE